jgi:hypothetical protein
MKDVFHINSKFKMTNKNIKISNFLERNQEKLLLLLGFVLVLFAGFFSGYFYSEEQAEKQEIVIEKPDLNCLNLFNADSMKNSSGSGLNVNNALQVKGEQSRLKNVNLQNKTGIFVASRNSKIYHRPDCKYAKRIKEENKIWFGSAEEAGKAGYKSHDCVKGVY